LPLGGWFGLVCVGVIVWLAASGCCCAVGVSVGVVVLTSVGVPGSVLQVAPGLAERLAMVCVRSLRTQQCAES
jgi:hypothetical protein